jgi:hypothetical protein
MESKNKMSKMELGLVLILTPFFLIGLTLVIVHHISAWEKAIHNYKQFDDRFELVCVSIATIFEIIICTGVYLILSK